MLHRTLKGWERPGYKAIGSRVLYNVIGFYSID